MGGGPEWSGGQGGPDVTHRPHSYANHVHARDVTLDKSAAGAVRAETAELKMSAAALLKTESANLSMSAAGLTYAKDDASLNWSSASLMAAGSEVRMQYSGAQIVAAGGPVRLLSSLAGAVLARTAHADRAYIGLLVAGKAELGEGTKVLLQPGGAAAMGAGFAGGLLLALAFLWKLLARGRRRRGSPRETQRPHPDRA
jgi:hypothetical protein